MFTRIKQSSVFYSFELDGYKKECMCFLLSFERLHASSGNSFKSFCIITYCSDNQSKIWSKSLYLYKNRNDQNWFIASQWFLSINLNLTSVHWRVIFKTLWFSNQSIRGCFKSSSQLLTIPALPKCSPVGRCDIK